MLQNDAVRNLQYDSEIRVAQQSRSEPRGLLYIISIHNLILWVNYNNNKIIII